MKTRKLLIFLIPILAVFAPQQRLAAAVVPFGKKPVTKKDTKPSLQMLYRYQIGDKFAQFIKHTSHRSHSSHSSHVSSSYGSSSSGSVYESSDTSSTPSSRPFAPIGSSVSSSAIAQNVDISQYSVKTTTADANLRIEPRADAAIIGIIAKSQIVYIKETKEDWSRVYIQFEKMTLIGWVNNSLLQ